MENGVSVCLTAWNTQDFIEECLDSVMNQDYFKTHDNYEILLGIDACLKTLEKVQKIRHKYKNLRVFFTERNCGTYILSNSIMSSAKFDHIIRFDTDDIMLPNLVSKLISYKNADIISCKFKDFPNSKNEGIAYGTIMIKYDIFLKYGGYMPWKCAADSELITRLSSKANIEIVNTVLMKRRVRGSSLTHANGTNMQSNLRKRYLSYIYTKSKNTPAIIMQTIDLKEIMPDAQISHIQIGEPFEINFDFGASNNIESVEIKQKKDKPKYSDIIYNTNSKPISRAILRK